MTTCRMCGDHIREGDDVLVVDHDMVHTSCVEAPREPERRQVGAWAAFGAAGQMAMGDVQRNNPI